MRDDQATYAYARWMTDHGDAYPWALFGALATAGFGSGLFTVPFFTAALDRIQAHETGSAAGLLNAVQQFGSTLGTAVLGSVFFDTMGSGGDPVGTAARAARLAFAVALGLLAATLLTAHTMRKPLREKPNPAVADSRRLDRVA